jgi:signal transduction histidine kinase
MEKLKATNGRLLQSQSMSKAGQMAAVVAREVGAPIGSALRQVEGLGKLLDDYRQLVRKYDAAVQYCLQPVEMIFGADKAGLDQLVKHVEEARRKLFNARRDLEKSALLTEAKALLAEAALGMGRSTPLLEGLRQLTEHEDDGPTFADINQCIDAAINLLAPTWGERIAVMREFSTLPGVSCLPAQVCRAFLHILDNAALAIDGRGTVSVQTRAGGTRNIEIRIGDSGSGIDELILPEIFEPFFSTRANALGLGLSEAYGIVKAHGGSINVRTSAGSGSTFIISLPILAASTVSAPALAARR